MPKGYRRDDLKKDQKIGNLYLRERIVIKTGKVSRVYWICQCVCSKRWRVRQDEIISGGTHSCGCRNPAKCTSGKAHNRWAGRGDISAYNLAMLRYRARKLGIEWDLDLEYVWELFEEQDGKCKLTGLPLQFMISRRRPMEIEQTASLDRISSDRGYVRGNVQWVHKVVNLMKNHFEEETFIVMCNLVAKRHPRARKDCIVGPVKCLSSSLARPMPTTRSPRPPRPSPSR